MGEKGERTKQHICTHAYQLFAKKGYKDVTMKDICDSTGLSRGGLYRHYDSTEQIFMEIVTQLLENQQNEFTDKMNHRMPAAEILNDVLRRYEVEMIDADQSLSLAIYEFFSNPLISKSENSIAKQYSASKKMWMELIEYGINRNEFRKTEPEAIFDLIVFSYQGVRMYSSLMEIDSHIPKRILMQIKTLLLCGHEEAV